MLYWYVIITFNNCYVNKRWYLWINYIFIYFTVWKFWSDKQVNDMNISEEILKSKFK